jgi:hypothetical protein
MTHFVSLKRPLALCLRLSSLAVCHRHTHTLRKLQLLETD